MDRNRLFGWFFAVIFGLGMISALLSQPVAAQGPSPILVIGNESPSSLPAKGVSLNANEPINQGFTAQWTPAGARLVNAIVGQNTIDVTVKFDRPDQAMSLCQIAFSKLVNDIPGLPGQRAIDGTINCINTPVSNSTIVMSFPIYRTAANMPRCVQHDFLWIEESELYAKLNEIYTAYDANQTWMHDNNLFVGAIHFTPESCSTDWTSATPTATYTSSPTSTNTPTPSPTLTNTPSPSPTNTASPTATTTVIPSATCKTLTTTKKQLVADRNDEAILTVTADKAVAYQIKENGRVVSNASTYTVKVNNWRQSGNYIFTAEVKGEDNIWRTSANCSIVINAMMHVWLPLLHNEVVVPNPTPIPTPSPVPCTPNVKGEAFFNGVSQGTFTLGNRYVDPNNDTALDLRAAKSKDNDKLVLRITYTCVTQEVYKAFYIPGASSRLPAGVQDYTDWDSTPIQYQHAIKYAAPTTVIREIDMTDLLGRYGFAVSLDYNFDQALIPNFPFDQGQVNIR